MPPDRSLRLTLNTDAHWPPHKCCKSLHDSVLDRKDLSGSAVCLVRNRTMEVLDTDIYAPMIPTPQDVCAASSRGRRRSHGRASLTPRPTSCMSSRQRAAITMALLTGTSCGHLGRLQRRPRLQRADDDAGPPRATMARAQRQRGRAPRRTRRTPHRVASGSNVRAARAHGRLRTAPPHTARQQAAHFVHRTAIRTLPKPYVCDRVHVLKCSIRLMVGPDGRWLRTTLGLPPVQLLFKARHRLGCQHR